MSKNRIVPFRKPTPAADQSLTAAAIQKRFIGKLDRLDAQQMQILEIVLEAILRGGR